MIIVAMPYLVWYTQAEYANGLPGLELFFVSVHKGSHIIGGTTQGRNFVQNVAPYIPYTFVGYLSSQSGSLSYVYKYYSR